MWDFLGKRMDATLEKSEVRVAAPKNDDVTIYGFAILQPPKTVHYVYVRNTPDWRRMGIATALLAGVEPSTCTMTTWTDEVSGPDGWIRSKYKNFKYVPFHMKDE